ncbi:MAG: protoglobin domain-containing protein [Chloroflexi bacterium]|nr:protoglobin domain-containing protein [Chloroflexota bacterium]
MSRIVDWPARMKEVAGFVGLGQNELDIIESTRELVLGRGDELTAEVYDHFLLFPETRRFFLDEDGDVNDEKLERRKHSLMRWLRGSIDFKIDEDYPIRLLATGIVHSYPPSHRAHMGSIPSRFMVGSISFVQTALAQIFHESMEDPEQAHRATVAWNKMLMVQLDILLAGYVNETPTEATGEAPVVPDFD